MDSNQIIFSHPIESDHALAEQRMVLQELLKAFVELNRLQAEPGDKAYRLNRNIEFLRRHIREIVKAVIG